MRELEDIQEKNKRNDLLIQGMEEVPVFNGNINDCEEWQLVNLLLKKATKELSKEELRELLDRVEEETKCEHYEEDEWGICKHKLDWKNKKCKNNCCLKKK